MTVVDDWHGRGVATALLDVLMRRRPAGVERIVTVVKADNRASVAMLRRLGAVELGDPESGTRRVVVDLAGRSHGAPHDQRGEPAPARAAVCAGEPSPGRRPAPARAGSRAGRAPG